MSISGFDSALQLYRWRLAEECNYLPVHRVCVRVRARTCVYKHAGGWGGKLLYMSM